MTSYRHYDLIKRPVITEKGTYLAEQNKFVFEVTSSADKPSIKSAIEKIFEVKVKKVNILNIKGKVKRFKGRLGKQADTKKAVVTLESGYNIDFTGRI